MTDVAAPVSLADAQVMPRRLTMQILHAAQVAQPASIRGVVTAKGGQPVALHLDQEVAPEGETLWAGLWSNPQAPAVPAAAELVVDRMTLVVSLNTKGVLEMRGWRLRDGEAVEVALSIHD